MNTVSLRFTELTELIPQFEREANQSISLAANMIANAFSNGNKILICGNGGSAADSQHFAAEFVNAFSRDLNRRALSAVALSTDTSVMSSIANDFSYDNIFARQLEAHGKNGDILIALTTSGASENCIRAVNLAKTLGVQSISFTQSKGQISRIADLSIDVPSSNTQHIQECHMLAYHVITEMVENILFRGGHS